MRGRKASNEHICDKQNPEKSGKWLIVPGQNIHLEKPKNKSEYDDIMCQKVLLVCAQCEATKHCSLEKLNIEHFKGSEYVIPENFWSKVLIGILNPAQQIKNKENVEKAAKALVEKAKIARMKKAISTSTTSEVSASPIKVHSEK